MRGEDSASAWLGGHGICDSTTVTARHALITETSMVFRRRRGSADGHAEALNHH
jgi:hypothetical protein